MDKRTVLIGAGLGLLALALAAPYAFAYMGGWGYGMMGYAPYGGYAPGAAPVAYYYPNANATQAPQGYWYGMMGYPAAYYGQNGTLNASYAPDPDGDGSYVPAQNYNSSAAASQWGWFYGPMQAMHDWMFGGRPYGQAGWRGYGC